MPGQPVKIGPFVGGMNIYSGPSAIGDNEAVELINMDIDLDGSLIARPGMSVLPPDLAATASHVLGTYRSTIGEVFIIVAAGNRVSAYSTSGLTWTVISNAGPFTSCVQYADKLWLTIKPAGAAVGGGKWDPVGGYSAVATMPRGYSSCIYKERMFLSASSSGSDTSINRVIFSNAGDFNTWTVGTDFFNVSAGDGDDITKLAVFDSSIVAFKSDSTFIFGYDSQPSKGQVQKVSGTIGANNAYCVVEYENNLFVMHEANVYRISNWNWEHANVKVPFDYVNSVTLSVADGSSLSLLGNRIVARYYDNYYVLGLKTGAWAQWQFKSRTNQVVNPSFEVDTSNWVIVGGQATITRDTSKQFHGAASCRLDTVINSTNAYATTTAGTMAAVPDEVRTASVYVTGSGTAEIAILPTDAGNALIGAPIQSGVIALTGAWQRLSVTATMPAGTTGYRIRVYQRTTNVANVLWFDAVLGEKTNKLLPFIVGTLNKHTPSEFVSNPNISPGTGAANFYGGSYTGANAGFFTFIDNRKEISEVFDMRLTTKAYDFGPSYAFKRLYWWGVDLVSNSTVAYKVAPVVYSVPVTWGQLAVVPWSQYKTWGRPLDVSIDVSDSVSSSNPAYYRVFQKLLKSLRFRQVQFILESTTDGTEITTGPLRIFSLTAFVDAKETVVKKVS